MRLRVWINGACLDGHAGAMETEGEETSLALKALKANSKLALNCEQQVDMKNWRRAKITRSKDGRNRRSKRGWAWLWRTFMRVKEWPRWRRPFMYG